MQPSLRRHHGFTIVEVITALTIIAIIGLAMTKLILGQTRSFQYDNGARRARAAARSAMNILITDLRMTQDNGGVSYLDAVNNRRIDVRVPLAFGVVCEVNALSAVIALVPVDSFEIASAKYGGYATRNATTGAYTYTITTALDTVQNTGSGRCHGGGVNIFADTVTTSGRAGRVVLVTPAPPAGTVVGAPAFIWQTVTYEFKNSGMYPGSFGLYRVIRGRANTDTLSEELLAPFGSAARFAYYTMPSQAQDRPTTSAPIPVNYNTVRGFQITLPAQASDTVPGRTTPQTATTTTAVFFKNTRVQ